MTRPKHISRWLAIFSIVACALFVFYSGWVKSFIDEDRCLDAGGRYEATWKTCDKTDESPQGPGFSGALFVGTLQGQSIELQLRDDGLAYRMMENGRRIDGNLNTERGHGADDNAVVYVLNPSGPESRQIRLLVSKGQGDDERVLVGSTPNDRLRAVKEGTRK